ncbi:DNA-processing protein DprA, partial [Candidatus Uhrbacteria bacterium]|nr:DNA-processing protein DprA [Candidatus Uhrbacteria bacterium]
MSALEAWLGLAALVDEIGARRLGALVTAAGDAERAWNADRAILARVEWTPRATDRFLAMRASVDTAALARAIARYDITIIPRGDARYPPLLATIHDPPIALFVRGDTALLATRAIAVVGTRTPTPYGTAVVEHLVPPLARAGLTITSGLAYGIDGYAHDATLRVSGRTIAVLGTGVDPASISPSAHRALAERIITSGGCVVSEYV